MKEFWLAIVCSAAASRTAQETFSASPALDATVEAAVPRRLDSRRGADRGARTEKFVHRKAYGEPALVPSREADDRRHHLRRGVADQSDRHHAVADEAVRARQAAHRRSGDRISARISGRQQRHHHSRSDDAFFRAAVRIWSWSRRGPATKPASIAR